MQARRSKCYGFGLSEILIALAVIGVISVFMVPKLINSGTDKKWQAQVSDATYSLQDANQLANTDVGTLPIKMGPALAYLGRLNILKMDQLAAADVPASCKITLNGQSVFNDGDSHAILKSGVHVHGLSPKWLTTSTAGEYADYVCLYDGSKTAFVKIPHDKMAVAEAVSSGDSAGSTSTIVGSTDVASLPDGGSLPSTPEITHPPSDTVYQLTLEREKTGGGGIAFLFAPSQSSTINIPLALQSQPTDCNTSNSRQKCFWDAYHMYVGRRDHYGNLLPAIKTMDIISPAPKNLIKDGLQTGNNIDAAAAAAGKGASAPLVFGQSNQLVLVVINATGKTTTSREPFTANEEFSICDVSGENCKTEHTDENGKYSAILPHGESLMFFVKDVDGNRSPMQLITADQPSVSVKTTVSVDNGNYDWIKSLPSPKGKGPFYESKIKPPTCSPYAYCEQAMLDINQQNGSYFNLVIFLNSRLNNNRYGTYTDVTNGLIGATGLSAGELMWVTGRYYMVDGGFFIMENFLEWYANTDIQALLDYYHSLFS